MKANKMKKLKKKIKTWKVWFSKSMFGFHDFDDICVHSLATPYEPKPDAIIYGLDIYDALKRYIDKRPYARNIQCDETSGDTFAKVAVLPNHGLRRAACPWSLNLPKHVEFWK
jgi:hypothetical protein